jgi:hypothetical protein
MDVQKDLVMGVVVRFVSVDVEERRRREVVLSIREELSMMFVFGVKWDEYYMIRRSTSSHIASAHVECGESRLQGIYDVTMVSVCDERAHCLIQCASTISNVFIGSLPCIGTWCVLRVVSYLIM